MQAASAQEAVVAEVVLLVVMNRIITVTGMAKTYKNGATLAEIAEASGVSISTVASRLKAHEKRGGKARVNRKVDIEKLLTFARAGTEWVEIARLLGYQGDPSALRKLATDHAKRRDIDLAGRACRGAEVCSVEAEEGGGCRISRGLIDCFFSLANPCQIFPRSGFPPTGDFFRLGKSRTRTAFSFSCGRECDDHPDVQTSSGASLP